MSYQHVIFYGDGKTEKFSLLDVEVIRKEGKFSTKIQRKPTFSEVYSNFESFLPSFYEFSTAYTVV